MGIRVSANTLTRLIEVTEAPVIPAGQSVALQTLDVQIDVYSDLKEDWLNLVPGIKRGTVFPLVNSVSANTNLPGGRKEPTFTRIRNDLGWRFLPFDSDHELTLLGNLLPFDDTLPIIQGRPGRSILVIPDATQVAGLNIETAQEAAESAIDNKAVLTRPQFLSLKDT